jgi:hypothetical protein
MGDMVKEVMTPKTHVLVKLKKYAAYALSYLDKEFELHFKTHLRYGVSRPTFTSKRLLRKYFRGLQQKSHRWITSKLLLVLETGVILMIALYEDATDGQSKN